MGFMHTLLAAIVIAFLFATALFFLALKKKDNSIADEAWGLSFILVAWGTLVLSGSYNPRQIMACVLILIWGLRLSVRITLRNRGKGEDIRYRKWREEWGRSFVIRSYLQVFLLQAALMLCNITPVLFINTYDTGTIGWLDAAAVLLWAAGFGCESLADWQLDRFIKNPANRGRIMDRGLWHYSRHPNYFGEVTMWWAIYVLALSVPWGWISVIGPLTITYLILFVSGVPMTERFMQNIPGFEEYKRKTSIFVPWFPKKV
ncbi:MAG: DUF1295 domain-containing protein [Syntrophaceae bacterium]